MSVRGPDFGAAGLSRMAVKDAASDAGLLDLTCQLECPIGKRGERASSLDKVALLRARELLSARGLHLVGRADGALATKRSADACGSQHKRQLMVDSPGFGEPLGE